MASLLGGCLGRGNGNCGSGGGGGSGGSGGSVDGELAGDGVAAQDRLDGGQVGAGCDGDRGDRRAVLDPGVDGGVRADRRDRVEDGAAGGVGAQRQLVGLADRGDRSVSSTVTVLGAAAGSPTRADAQLRSSSSPTVAPTARAT